MHGPRGRVANSSVTTSLRSRPRSIGRLRTEGSLPRHPLDPTALHPLMPQIVQRGVSRRRVEVVRRLPRSCHSRRPCQMRKKTSCTTLQRPRSNALAVGEVAEVGSRSTEHLVERGMIAGADASDPSGFDRAPLRRNRRGQVEETCSKRGAVPTRSSRFWFRAPSSRSYLRRARPMLRRDHGGGKTTIVGDF